MTAASSGKPSGHLALESDADSHEAADWERAAAAVLRRSRRLTEDDPDSLVWERLTRQLPDGIDVPPLGTPALLEGLTTAGRPDRSGPWDNRVLVTGEAGVANESALADLANGAGSLWVRVDGPVPPGDLEARLSGVLGDLAPVVLDAPDDPVGAARALASWLRGTGVTPARGTGLGADPIGTIVRGGEADVAGVVAEVAPLAAAAGVLGLVVDGTAVHDQGASDAQEVGFSLAAGAAYLRLLTGAGVGLEEALGLLEFRYAATDEQFPTIAKIRAARRCWARVAALSGATGAGAQRQHVVTSRPMMSKYDPWVNILRATVAAFAAGVGGADAVTVLPFDTPLGQPDALGRRVARNTGSLLMAEAHVAEVADPAGGSYAVEKLTDDIARAAWAELGRIEESGGVLAALADGSLRSRIAEVVAVRDREIATRARPLTGLSEFPNLGEELPVRAGAVDDGVRRYGAAYEALRDDPATRPVFLATMGTVAAHTARATFATNLLAAGGVAVEPAGVTHDVAGVLAAYGGHPVACLAGPDPAYAAWGGELVAALREAGVRHVILAGKPGPTTVEGVDDSCAMGVDALAFLTRTRLALRPVEGEVPA